MHDEVGLGDGLSGVEEHLSDAHLPHPEAVGDLLEDAGVGVAAQDGQFGEGLGDDLDVVAPFCSNCTRPRRP
ncbi:hypothetical protein SMD44_08707 [Streptomyces alboflavus]|uniref:Uncharacterized protein n=1 Tax=Streptomyces alboflavus TaxID=67267 RepID=A0A1Z1WS10_9ACTN|nr:hypothetical protein [Streptomyces alboflavus]ARX89220.1 hypothetical protein SMD44_08707 [Streptomyces alboflavus]